MNEERKKDRKRARKGKDARIEREPDGESD